jgi:hypothetical protein
VLTVGAVLAIGLPAILALAQLSSGPSGSVAVSFLAPGTLIAPFIVASVHLFGIGVNRPARGSAHSRR